MVLRRFLDTNVFRFLVMPTVAFVAMAVLTTASVLIPILNLIVISLSFNVCVAFGPEVAGALLSRRELDKTDYLALGIFTSWAALVLRSGWVLAWRWLGEPHWMTETDFSSFFIALAAYAAILHLIAPGAIRESVPTKRWVMIGAWIAVAVFVGLLMVYSSDLQQRLHSVSTPNDTAPTLSGLVRPL